MDAEDVVKIKTALTKKLEWTPSGYRAGFIKASDGARYQVRETGQMVRVDDTGGTLSRLSKAEKKRLKRERVKQIVLSPRRRLPPG